MIVIIIGVVSPGSLFLMMMGCDHRRCGNDRKNDTIFGGAGFFRINGMLFPKPVFLKSSSTKGGIGSVILLFLALTPTIQSNRNHPANQKQGQNNSERNPDI